MDENELKRKLSQVFESPKAKRKEAFLQELNAPRITVGEFIRVQIAYISKISWLLSVLLVGFALLLGYGGIFQGSNISMLWAFSSILPLGCVLTVAEVSRSGFSGMWELEMSTRYSLEDVVIARILAITGFQFVLLLLSCLLVERYTSFGILRIAVYLTVPCLVNGLVSLWIARNLKGSSIRWCCLTISVLLCGLYFACAGRLMWIYEARYLMWWILLLGALACVNGRELFKMKKNLEEYVWS